MFLWELCWLIMESTSRRGNSNYFPWLRSKPLHLIQRTIPPQTPRAVISKHSIQFHKSHSPTKGVCHSQRTHRGPPLHYSLDFLPLPFHFHCICEGIYIYLHVCNTTSYGFPRLRAVISSVELLALSIVVSWQMKGKAAIKLDRDHP